MLFDQPLIRGTLVKRYKRFLADVLLADDMVVTAHCPNTGSMLSCGSPGDQVWLSKATSGTRKLSYTWEYSQTHTGALIGVHTQRPNQMVKEALLAKKIPALAAYDTIKPEATWGGSRFDFMLTSHEGLPRAWVEVKNVTWLTEDSIVRFPDAVSLRGLKHLEGLMTLKAQGDKAVMLYVCNRMDAQGFGCATQIDPQYGYAFARAKQAGVDILVYKSELSCSGYSLGPILQEQADVGCV